MQMRPKKMEDEGQQTRSEHNIAQSSLFADHALPVATMTQPNERQDVRPFS